MNNLEKYLSEIKKELPDIEDWLNRGADEEQLERLRSGVGCEIPEELISLYGRFNGEEPSKAPGFMAGMGFMDVGSALHYMDFYRTADEEMTAMGTKAVREQPLSELNWIPFAHDWSRAWLAMDLSPTENGTVGQIIAVDYDSNCCYLLADSMEEWFEKMTLWFRRGILSVHTGDDGKPYIGEQTGHLFNSLEKLAVMDQSPEALEIPLPEGFWQERYKKMSVSVSSLDKEKRMLLQKKEIDCTPFAHMANMKELILHDCHLTNLGALARMPQLKRLIFAGCTLEGENLSVLADAPNLKELGLNVMSGAGLVELSGLKSLKCLQVRALTDITVGELAPFQRLQELSIEKMGLRDAAFIGGMKQLKKLDLYNSELIDLDFLKNLTKLTEFHLKRPAENESGLSAVNSLPKLKEFIYPVRDLSVYKGAAALESVGMDADIAEGFEVFAGSRVKSFTLLGKDAREQMERVREQMDQYVKVFSYGVQG